jgi:hypothetical protein
MHVGGGVARRFIFTSFDDFRSMDASDIMLVVPGVNKRSYEPEMIKRAGVFNLLGCLLTKYCTILLNSPGL